MNYFKKIICKYFNIKACKCADKIFVRELKESVDHCSTHKRFMKSCLNCLIIVKGEKKNG